MLIAVDNESEYNEFSNGSGFDIRFVVAITKADGFRQYAKSKAR